MRKKGLMLAIFILISFFLLISNNSKVNGELNIGRLKEDDVFIWDVKYNNSYEPALNFWGVITYTIEEVNEDNLSISIYDGTEISSDYVKPQNALDYLPMGFSVDILYQPDIIDIIKPISIITTDWVQQRDKWHDRDTINTFGYVDWIWHRNFTYNGALRSIYNFTAISINYNFNEPTAMNFTITYTEKNGFMLFYNLKLLGIDSDNYIDLSISLVSSTKGIGWSYLMKIIIAFVPMYSIITLIGLGTLAYIGIKKYIKNLPKKKEEEEEYFDEDDEEEVDHFEKVIKEEVKDYSFIRICPFCKAEVSEDADICPECGGKK